MHCRVVGYTVLAAGFLAGCADTDRPSAGSGESTARIASAVLDSNYALDLNPDLLNPERGVAYWFGSTQLDPSTLANLFLYLGDENCRTDLFWTDINSASPVLKAWANDALSLRAAGRKVIFRPRYDLSPTAGAPNNCTKVEGNSYLQMQNHVQAIAAMLADPMIKPTVAFIEMGYLGSWGEWNTSGTSCGTSWAACDDLAPVLLAGLDPAQSPPSQDRVTFSKYVIDAYAARGVTRPVELRRPQFHSDLSVYYGVLDTSMGFYNDCFMNDPVSAGENGSDGGTFTKLESGYNQPSPPAVRYPSSVLSPQSVARSYMRTHVVDGTQGGESCSPNGTAEWSTNPANVPGRMDSDGFAYFHPGTRDANDFRGRMMSTADAVYGNVWNAIRSQLGYRFHAANVSYPASVASGASMTLSVDIQNSGFAKFPNYRTAYFVLRGTGGNFVVGTSNPKPDTYAVIAPTSQLNPTVRNWNEDASTTFSQTFPAPPAGTYTVHLYIPDPDCIASGAQCDDTVKKNYAVKLATKRNGVSVFDDTLGTNNLGVSVTVATNGCAGAGNILQNCGFDTAFTPWRCDQGGTAAATCSVVNGQLQTVITNPGTATYHVQPNQQGLALTNGITYTVSFDARASVARPITVSVSMNHTPFSSLSGARTFNITTSMSNYNFTFPMTAASDSNVKFEFDLGANGSNTVYIDNVVLRP
jgi:hypothetical protein